LGLREKTPPNLLHFCPQAVRKTRRPTLWRGSQAKKLHFPFRKILHAQNLKCKESFSGEAGHRFAAAGGGSAQISLLGFMYQI